MTSGVYHTRCNVFLPLLRLSQCPMIVNVSSTTGSFATWPDSEARLVLPF